MATLEEIMAQRRPVEQQLDARAVLNALGQTVGMMPEMSYAGLSPENVARASSLTANYLGEQQKLLQQTQEAARQQEAQQYGDALRANQLQMAQEELALNQALKGLQMQQMRQSMGQSAAAHALAQAKGKLELERLQSMSGLANMPIAEAVAGLTVGQAQAYPQLAQTWRALNKPQSDLAERRFDASQERQERLERESYNRDFKKNRETLSKDIQNFGISPDDLDAKAHAITRNNRQAAGLWNPPVDSSVVPSPALPQSQEAAAPQSTLDLLGISPQELTNAFLELARKRNK